MFAAIFKRDLDSVKGSDVIAMSIFQLRAIGLVCSFSFLKSESDGQ